MHSQQSVRVHCDARLSHSIVRSVAVRGVVQIALPDRISECSIHCVCGWPWAGRSIAIRGDLEPCTSIGLFCRSCWLSPACFQFRMRQTPSGAAERLPRELPPGQSWVCSLQERQANAQRPGHVTGQRVPRSGLAVNLARRPVPFRSDRNRLRLPAVLIRSLGWRQPAE